MNRINLEQAFVLHTRPFRDTSLLIHAFTLNHGHLMLLARGARAQKSPLRPLLLPFTPLLISWVQKTDLPIVSKVETNDLQYFLNGEALVNGMYLNELLVRLLERHNAYPNLFNVYQETLSSLQNKDNQKISLRLFEKKLLAELGYGLQLQKEQNSLEILPTEHYSFEFGTGFKKFEANRGINPIFSGKSLIALHNENFSHPNEVNDAGNLLQIALKHLLGSQPIKTLDLLN